MKYGRMNKPDIDHDWDEFTEKWERQLMIVRNMDAEGIIAFIRLGFVTGYREGYRAALVNAINDARQAMNAIDNTEIA